MVTLSSMIKGNRLDVFGIDPDVAKYGGYAIKNLTTNKRAAEFTIRTSSPLSAKTVNGFTDWKKSLV